MRDHQVLLFLAVSRTDSNIFPSGHLANPTGAEEILLRLHRFLADSMLFRCVFHERVCSEAIKEISDFTDQFLKLPLLRI